MRYLAIMILLAGCTDENSDFNPTPRLAQIGDLAPFAAPDLTDEPDMLTAPDLADLPDMATVRDLSTAPDLSRCVDSTVVPIKYPQCFDSSDCGGDVCNGAKKCADDTGWRGGQCCVRWGFSPITPYFLCCPGLRLVEVQKGVPPQCL